MLSPIFTWLEFTCVVVPSTVKLPPTCISPPTPTPPVTVNAPVEVLVELVELNTFNEPGALRSSGNPTVTLFVPVAVSISLVVPSISNTSVSSAITSFDPLSALTVNCVLILTLPAAVNRPLASTVNVGIAEALPYEPAVTSVSFRSKSKF